MTHHPTTTPPGPPTCRHSAGHATRLPRASNTGAALAQPPQTQLPRADHFSASARALSTATH